MPFDEAARRTRWYVRCWQMLKFKEAGRLSWRCLLLSIAFQAKIFLLFPALHG